MTDQNDKDSRDEKVTALAEISVKLANDPDLKDLLDKYLPAARDRASVVIETLKRPDLKGADFVKKKNAVFKATENHPSTFVEEDIVDLIGDRLEHSGEAQSSMSDAQRKIFPDMAAEQFIGQIAQRIFSEQSEGDKAILMEYERAAREHHFQGAQSRQGPDAVVDNFKKVGFGSKQ